MQNVCFTFLYNFYVEHFYILRNVQRDIVRNMKTSSWKVTVIRIRFLMKHEFSRHRFGKKKKAQTSNFMKIRLVGAELLQDSGGGERDG
jgi:hypothetical protein